jgi:hypothetical protein
MKEIKQEYKVWHCLIHDSIMLEAMTNAYVEHIIETATRANVDVDVLEPEVSGALRFTSENYQQRCKKRFYMLKNCAIGKLMKKGIENVEF